MTKDYILEGKIMKLRKFLTAILTLLTIVFITTGCSSDNSKKKSTSSSKTTSIENKPLKKFDSVQGKIYITNGSYKGKAKKDINSISWQKTASKHSFVFINGKKAFVGRYVDSKLNYGHFYDVSKSKNGFFSFKETSFITDQNNYKKMKTNVKNTYSVANHKNIPDATQGVQYYQVNEASKSRKAISYRFYRGDDGILIRENKPNKGVHYYFKNVDKDK